MKIYFLRKLLQRSTLSQNLDRYYRISKLQFCIAQIAIQHNIYDIELPLFYLYARVSTLEGGDNVEATKDSVRLALRQWSKAQLHVKNQRRRAVVYLVAPLFEFFRAGPDSFLAGAEAREKLFTLKFLESMLKEASRMQCQPRKDALAMTSKSSGSVSHLPG